MKFSPSAHPPLTAEEAIQLLATNRAPEAKLQKKYQNTSHFRSLTAKMVEQYQSCVMCGKTQNLVVHHRHYRTLFNESTNRDVTLVCQRCHGKHHRGRR